MNNISTENREQSSSRLCRTYQNYILNFHQ